MWIFFVPNPDITMSEKESSQIPHGRIPTRAEMLKSQIKQRRYFDSGDYAMSKAGKKPEPGQEIGSEHPQPGNIPHRSALLASARTSPVRRPSRLVQSSDAVRIAAARGNDIEDENDGEHEKDNAA